MNHPTRLTAVCIALSFALPVRAQDGDVSMGYFTTTDMAHVQGFEEGMLGHVGWHAEQDDPWPGYVYQSMQGGMEYVWVTSGRTWADFDNPPVDPHADMMDVAQRAGSDITGLDVRTWVTWTDVSRPPSPDAVVPIWRVIEWELSPTAEGMEALRSAFGKVKAAYEAEGLPVRYTVNEMVGIDGAPQMFVAIALESLGLLDGGEPDGFERMLAQVHGHADAVQISRTFETYLSPIANRVWVLRPDLSHMPGT